jgi:hypothetical protein
MFYIEETHAQFLIPSSTKNFSFTVINLSEETPSTSVRSKYTQELKLTARKVYGFLIKKNIFLNKNLVTQPPFWRKDIRVYKLSTLIYNTCLPQGLRDVLIMTSPDFGVYLYWSFLSLIIKMSGGNFIFWVSI